MKAQGSSAIEKPGRGQPGGAIQEAEPDTIFGLTQTGKGQPGLGGRICVGEGWRMAEGNGQ